MTYKPYYLSQMKKVLLVGKGRQNLSSNSLERNDLNACMIEACLMYIKCYASAKRLWTTLDYSEQIHCLFFILIMAPGSRSHFLSLHLEQSLQQRH